MGRLDNKVVLITGSRGMGAATARMAAAEGARVFIAALAPEECELLSAEVGGGWYSAASTVSSMSRESAVAVLATVRYTSVPQKAGTLS
jgi:3alpha(or 20beta)-hydroxysteroid dehydrogenase